MNQFDVEFYFTKWTIIINEYNIFGSKNFYLDFCSISYFL